MGSPRALVFAGARRRIVIIQLHEKARHLSPSAVAHKRAPSLADRLVGELSHELMTGALRPGDKLPTEAQVVRRHGVSRSVVREALSRLQAAGLVETRHGVGTFVTARR